MFGVPQACRASPANLKIRGKKLKVSLGLPLDLMVNRSGHLSWLGDLDSNQGCPGQSREFHRLTIPQGLTA